MGVEAKLGILPVYSAPPTIRVNGAEVANARALLLSMEMHEQSGGMAQLELKFSNIASDPGGGAKLAFDGSAFDFGKTITVYSGDEYGPMEIFRGCITALEANFPESSEPELIVLAEDGFHKARWTRITKFESNLT